MMRGAVFPLLALMLMPASGFAGDAWTATISGEVRVGEHFAASLPGGLLFALDAVPQAPPNPPGWTIGVRRPDRPEVDLVWPANPPYRSDNVRYLDTSYGKTPEQMLEWNPREFLFYSDSDTAEAGAEWVRAMLWPSGEEPPARPEPRGMGVLTILDSRIGLVGGVPAVVWLRFEARLTMEPALR